MQRGVLSRSNGGTAVAEVEGASRLVDERPIRVRGEARGGGAAVRSGVLPGGCPVARPDRREIEADLRVGQASQRPLVGVMGDTIGS